MSMSSLIRPLARSSVAVMETKNFENKLAKASTSLSELARTSGNTSLERMSQRLSLTRVSRMGKGRADIESGVHDAQTAITEIEEAAEGIAPEHRAALDAQVAELRTATARLAESKQAMK